MTIAKGARRSACAPCVGSDAAATHARLVPSLRGSSDTAKEDGQVKQEGVRPLVQHLVLKSVLLFAAELVDVLKVCWVLSHEGTPLEEVDVRLESFLGGKSLNLAEELALAKVGERIDDLALRTRERWKVSARSLPPAMHARTHLLGSLLKDGRRLKPV